MRQENKGRIKRPIIKIGIAVTASAVISAGAVSLSTSASPVATMPFVTTAAIDTSNTTVGFADSDLYGMTPADVDRTLDEMQAMGVQNVRILIPWSGIEVVDDFYYWDTVDYLVNAAYERDMGVLGVLNSTPAWAVEPGQAPVVSPPASTEEYAEFVGAVAERYAGKISAADPDATVIGGVVGWVTDTENLAISPANYVAGMYEAGARGYFDALSYHPYHYTLPFSQGELYGDISPIGQLELMRELMVANGDGDKLIWATEYGEPTSVVDEATQAAFIQDYLSTWSEFSYTGPSFIYTTRDRDTESTVVDDTFGVLRDDWSRKPAAEVIEQWTTTYPQAPDPVDLVAVTASTSTTPTTTAEVAPMEATTVPSSALTTEPAGTTDSTESTDSARSNGNTKKTR